MKDGHSVLGPDLRLGLVMFALGCLAFAQKKGGPVAILPCGLAAIVWCMHGSGIMPSFRIPLEAIHMLSGMEDPFPLLAEASLAA
jgi:hypothetical protein